MTGAQEVLPGIWRLALELPWPGAPAANAWALAAGDGVVLVDCGLHSEGSFRRLTTALGGAGFVLSDVRLLACTHAHADHVGEAAAVRDAAGCELWLHPDHRHGFAPLADIDAEVARRLATGRRCGLPEEALQAYGAALRAQEPGIVAVARADRMLFAGAKIATDAGRWQVIETPGHAPSHVCLHEPQAGLLLSGDHLLDQPSIVFEHGWAADPVGDLLRSLDRVEALGARRCLPGHGAPFDDVAAAIDATRTVVHERLDAVRGALAAGARTPLEVAEHAYAASVGPEGAGWMFADALCLLEHLELLGEARLGAPLSWSPVIARSEDGSRA